jgi:protocatechuate 3,4-dioxygenase beta subunit
MDNDDKPVGQILSRRRALALFGLAGAGVTALGGTATAWADSSTGDNSTAAADVVARPEMTEGPYFVDEKLNRSDIRVDTADGSVADGTRLDLALIVSSIAGQTVTPISGATVDIWHCNALGVYSDETAQNTVGHNYLRGYQVTNSGGLVNFTTILPGWYTGRTVHIHLKIRTTGTDGNSYEFTSQLFFTEALKAAYLATEPYSAKGMPDTTNATDNIYGTVGDQMLLTPTKNGDGYKAILRIGLDLSDTSVAAADGFSAGDGGGGLPGPMPSGEPPSGAPSPTP